jgi:hypothetical protein
MRLKKYYKNIVILFFFIITIFTIKNLGYFFDITQQAIKSDVILCLGGDTENRVKIAFKLYEENFSFQNKIILTDKYQTMINTKLTFLKTKGLDDNNIFFNSETSNTYQELLFVKEYMIKNNYKSIIILSTNPQSKRIDMLIKNFINFSENNISYTIVGENPKWWNKETYYYDNKAIVLVIKEFFKIIYNYGYYKLDSIIKFDDETTNNLIKYKTSISKYFNSVFL